MPAFPAVFELSSLDGSNGTRLIVWTTYDNGGSGSTIAGVGDLNGDGFDDLAIGSPRGEGWSQYDIGTVTDFLGSAGPFPLFQYSTPGLAGRYQEDFGRRIEGLGDINGDGFADLVVEGSGSFYYIDVAAGDYHWESSPRSYIVFGHETYWAVEASSSFAGFSAAGDVNGDGFDDVVVAPAVVLFGSADGFPTISIPPTSTRRPASC
ncbi:integrin alpha [Oleomonas cavernae]|nr:integrin alpha [Oleomonas cavernae]